jgi:hypothetical protein
MNPADVPLAAPTQPPKSGLAITSLCLGIASFAMCLGLFTGIPAIITGHIAYNRAKRFPFQFGGKGLATAGFILGYVSLAFTLLVLPAMLLPALARAKQKAQTINCVNNLKQIGVAARIYSDAHNNTWPTDLKSIAGNVASPSVFKCPSDAHATAATSATDLSDANISYEIVNAENAKPDEVYVRCPIHNNVLLGDGSVQIKGRQKK